MITTFSQKVPRKRRSAPSVVGGGVTERVEKGVVKERLKCPKQVPKYILRRYRIAIFECRGVTFFFEIIHFQGCDFTGTQLEYVHAHWVE